MENQSLRKRLYQNLSQKPIKHTFLLEADPKSPSAVLKPKILQETLVEPQKSPVILLNKGKSLISNMKAEAVKKKVVKPKEVAMDKLSKEGKSVIEDGKVKIKNNLRPHQIFAFYDAFPEMMEDFFYLNRMGHPYDYQIVSYAKRNPCEYMTISSQGVTLYHDKEAEFLTRGQWLADEKIYYKLQKIDFFNQYKLSKNFGIWKNKMKLHYMKEMSTILNEKLFLTFDHPRDCLKKVRHSVLFLEDSLPYLPTENHDPMTWTKLLASCKDYQSHTLIGKIDEIERMVVRDLEEAIEKEIKNFKENNKIKIDGLNSQEENKEGYVYSQEAILRKQYKRVLKLIKLAEGILLESKIELVNRWMRQIIEKLREVNSSSLREEWIVLVFEAQPPRDGSLGISWNPTYEQFISTFRKIIEEAVQAICSKHQSIMGRPNFERYRISEEQQLMPREDKHNSLKNLIEESWFYTQLMGEIEECLKQEYEEVVKQEEELQKFIEIYAKHKGMPAMKQIIQENNPAEISLYVQEWRADNETMQKMPQHTSNMIHFDYELIKKAIKNIAQDSLKELFDELPSRLTELCHSTEREAKALLESINLIIPNDSNYVDLTKAVEHASENLQQIIETETEINQIVIILNSAERQINLNMNEMKGAIRELKAKVEEAHATDSHRLSKFKRDVDARILRIKAVLKDNTAVLDQIEANQNERDAASVIERIKGALPSITNITQQAANIEDIGRFLEVSFSNLDDVKVLHARAVILNDLWVCKKAWRELMEAMEQMHYMSVDCELMSQRVVEFMKEAEEMKCKLEGNEFLESLMAEISEFETLIELIKALQSKSLDDKARAEIAEYLAHEIFDEKTRKEIEDFQLALQEKRRLQKEEGIEANPLEEMTANEFPLSTPLNPIYTVQWLIDQKISLFKERVELIVKKSEKENELASTHVIMKSYINSLALDVDNTQKKRDVVLLGPNTKTFAELQDHLSSLLEIFNNEYSEAIKKETKVLSKHYEYVIEILEACMEFGENWEKYEGLFDPSRPYSKQLNKESKDFTNWENSWKKIIKMILMDGWSKRIHEENMGETPSRTTMKSIIKANIPWEPIKKGVEDFLDRRRAVLYHYFYFTDEKLMKLLNSIDGNQQFTPALVPLIYPHIESLQMKDEFGKLVSVTSKDGEELQVNKGIINKTVAEFEEILKSCEDAWKKSFVSNIKKVFSDFISAQDEDISRTKIVLDNVTQAVLAFDQIVWVKLAEETYLCQEPLGSLTSWLQIQAGQIEELYSILAQQDLSPTDVKKIHQVLLQAVYLRDKTQHLHQANVTSLQSYEWERILKLYEGTGNLHEKLYIKVLGSSIFYGGQFLGCSERQYITAETERSYINLVTAMHDRKISLLKTHNTETIQELAAFTAQSTRIFNFTDNIGMKMLSRVLAGACMQGSWACFSSPLSTELLSLLANQLTFILTSMQESANSSIQIGKYTINLNHQQPPSFFLMDPPQGELFYSRVWHDSFRPIWLAAPNIRSILVANTSAIDRDENAGEIIAELVQYCHELFSGDQYKCFDLRMGMRVLEAYRAHGEKDNKKKVILEIFRRFVAPRLTLDDQVIFTSFLDIYDFHQSFKLKSKKTVASERQKINPQLSRFIEDLQEGNKYGSTLIRDANTLYLAMTEAHNLHKKIVVVGENLCGKSTAIELVRQLLSQQRQRNIEVKRIYHSAITLSDLMIGGKEPSVVSKNLSEGAEDKWIVFDGVLGSDFEQKLSCLKDRSVLDGYGILEIGKHGTRVIVETNSLSSIPPTFVLDHSIVYMEKGEGRVLQILKSRLLNVSLSVYCEKSRVDRKSDETPMEVKYFQKVKKPIGLSSEMLEHLTYQLSLMIDRLAPSGQVRLKSVELLYNISSLELAYKLCTIAESVLKMNWDTIKDKDKNSKKVIQKFALWVVFWGMSGLVAPEDTAKFEKALCDILKVQGLEQLTQSVIYPGTGLEISSLKSQKAQNSLPNEPGRGIPTDWLSQKWVIFESESNPKKKFEQGVYLGQPYAVRVNTEESILFSYVSILSSFSGAQIAVHGPPGSGKKSIIELFNKNNYEKYDTYCLRAKWYDPYFVSKQIHTPFAKVQQGKRAIYRPTNISKELHVTIDDVSLTPQTEPTIEFLRMFGNQKGGWLNKSEWVSFRQFMLSIVITQANTHNIENVSFSRFLSRVSLVQVGSVTKQRLASIFGCIVEEWGINNSWPESSELIRIFTSRKGDSLTDATVNIFEKAREIANSYECNTLQNRNKRFLFAPKMFDLCGVITNLFCAPHDPYARTALSCAEKWAHEILRVFGDKLQSPQDRQTLLEEIKKQSLLKFKENFEMPDSHFIYSFLEEEGEPEDEEGQMETPYRRCLDIEDIKNILLDCRPELSLLYDEMISEIMKFYRLLKIEFGHALLVTPLPRPAKHLWKLASHMCGVVFHQIEGGQLSFESHMLPSVLNSLIGCQFMNSESLSEEGLYMLSCLLNKSDYDFNMSSEQREDVRDRILEISREMNYSSVKSKGSSDLSIINKKIELKINKLFAEEFMENSHFVITINPFKESTASFLHNNHSITKYLQAIWHQFKETTITTESRRIIAEDLLADKAPAIQSTLEQFEPYCRLIYETLADEQKNMAEYLKYLYSSVNLFNHTHAKLEEDREKTQMCLKKLEEHTGQLEKWRATGETIQKQLEDLVKRQDDLSHQIQERVEVEGETGALEAEMKSIKLEKESLEQKSREARTSEKALEDIIAVFPTRQDLNNFIAEKEFLIGSAMTDVIVVQAALLYLNKANETQYMDYFNQWVELLNKKKASSVEGILGYFENVLESKWVRIPSWSEFSEFSQLKGVHFLNNYYSSDSIFDHETFVIDDPTDTLAAMLSSIPEKGTYSDFYSTFRLSSTISELPPQKEDKKDKATKQSGLYLQLNERFSRKKTALVFVDRRKLPGISRSDLEACFTDPRRKIHASANQVVLVGGADAELTIQGGRKNLEYSLVEKSISMEYGEKTLEERRKSICLSKQIQMEERKIFEELIRKCLGDDKQNGKDDDAQRRREKKKNDLPNKKATVLAILGEQRMTASDGFLINWVLGLLPKEVDLEMMRRSVEMYESLKRELMELNFSLEQKVQSMQEIDLDVRSRWELQLRANVLDGQSLSLSELIKHTRPHASSRTIVFAQRFFCSESFLPKLLGESAYSYQFFNMQALKNRNHGHASANESTVFPETTVEKLNIFNNYFDSQQQALLDMMERLKDNTRPFIVLTDDPRSLVNSLMRSQSGLAKEYRLLVQQIGPINVDLLALNQSLEVNLGMKDKQLAKSMRRDFNEEIEKEESSLMIETTEELKMIKSTFKNFLILMMGQKLASRHPELPINFLLKKAEMVTDLASLEVCIEDFIPHLPLKWKLMLKMLSEPELDNEVEAMLFEASSLLKEFQINPNSPQPTCEESQDYCFIVNPTSEEIWSRIENLPYSFNTVDFSESVDLLAGWLKSMTQQFNEKRAFVKKYLQETLKIVSGTKLNYYSRKTQFGVKLPTAQFIQKLNAEHKALKKGLEFAGVISCVESSSSNIRVTNQQTVPNASLKNIANLALQASNIPSVSAKLLLIIKIRACRKLKLPLQQLRIRWKTYSPEGVVDETISPDLSALFQLQGEGKKILMLPYDPQVGVESVAPASKNLSKKEKNKRSKQELVKPIPDEMNPTLEGVPIRLSSGLRVGETFVKMVGGKSLVELLQEDELVIS